MNWSESGSPLLDIVLLDIVIVPDPYVPQVIILEHLQCIFEPHADHNSEVLHFLQLFDEVVDLVNATLILLLVQ